MRLATMLTAIMTLVLVWQPASAEFYRYVDKHGNVLYTDDISNVPLDQREAVKSFDEFKGASPAVAPPAQPKTTGQEDSPATEADSEWRQLEQERTQLDSEYDDLKQQRTILDEAKKNAVTPEQIKSYNQQIVEYNTRATALQEKYDAHDAKVKAYNEKAKAKSAPAESENE